MNGILSSSLLGVMGGNQLRPSLKARQRQARPQSRVLLPFAAPGVTPPPPPQVLLVSAGSAASVVLAA